MSVRKRKWITDGQTKVAWVFDYVDQYGKRRHETFRTQKDAKAAEKRIMAEISSGIHVANSETTTVSEAADAWMKRCEGKLEEDTLTSYRGILKFNITPFMGNRKINRITIKDVIKFQDELNDTPYPEDHTQKRFWG